MLTSGLTYGQAESTLARLHHAATGEIQERAFRGRLKHLLRLGIPLGPRPGKGKKVIYRDEELYQWAFALELAQAGLDPTVVVHLIEAKWSEILPKFMAARTEPVDQNDLLFAVHPQMMSAAWSEDPGGPLPFEWVRAGATTGKGEVPFGRWVQRLQGNTRRAIVLNISALLRQIGLERVMVDSANAAKGRSQANKE